MQLFQKLDYSSFWTSCEIELVRRAVAEPAEVVEREQAAPHVTHLAGADNLAKLIEPHEHYIYKLSFISLPVV